MFLFSESDYIGKRFNSVFFHNTWKLIDNILAGKRINEVCRSDFNSSSTCHHKLYYIFRARYTAHSDNGDFYSVCYLVNHSHCDWEDCRA